MQCVTHAVHTWLHTVCTESGFRRVCDFPCAGIGEYGIYVTFLKPFIYHIHIRVLRMPMAMEMTYLTVDDHLGRLMPVKPSERGPYGIIRHIRYGALQSQVPVYKPISQILTAFGHGYGTHEHGLHRFRT